MTYGLGLLAGGAPTSAELIRAAAPGIVFEYFIYQARYQWNDVRGFYSDQSHSAAGDRRRLRDQSTVRRPGSHRAPLSPP